jgi:hypothetical protein
VIQRPARDPLLLIPIEKKASSQYENKQNHTQCQASSKPMHDLLLVSAFQSFPGQEGGFPNGLVPRAPAQVL